MNILNQQQFYWLATDNQETQGRLRLLISCQRKEQQVYNRKLRELANLRQQLFHENTRETINPDDEAKRRATITNLCAQIDTFRLPQSPDKLFYQTERGLLERRLTENKKRSIALLIQQQNEHVN